MEFNHTPVLFNEVIQGLNIKENGIYLDGTIGGAGHSSEILKQIPKGFLIGLDQDLNALTASRKRLEKISNNFRLFHKNFKDFRDAMDDLQIDKVDGILLDLGVSSYQFDEGERGFSYRVDAPLDMRMNQEGGVTAKDIVNNYSEEDLTKILKEYGEEKWSSRIAKFIVETREKKSIETTFELVDIIKAAIPKKVRREGGHPAKKTFQALRIEVNQELVVLENTLNSLIDALNPGGRIAVITFHSLEDRIVKETFKYAYKDCICPPKSPICTCDKEREIEIITRKPIIASQDELEKNNRSHSAKLRIAEKL